jgi:hypothetical protein
MAYNLHHYKLIHKLTIYNLLPRYNIINNNRREIGLQIDDFQKRKNIQKLKDKRIASIKNQEWLG